MRGTIGYYVHHHGEGHLRRALAISEMMDSEVTLLGTGLAGRTGSISCVDLPDDRMDADFTGLDHGERPASLHFAPIDHEGVRQRVARMTQWIAQERPALMVVDVSVEIAMLARLASVPVVYVRLHGHRDDRPHQEVFEAATALLSPFHAALDDDKIPQGLRAKTFYAPNIVRPVRPRSGNGTDIIVVLGGGGSRSDGALWAQAARSVPDRRWQVIGNCEAPQDMPPNIEICGWVDDAEERIADAGIVVGGAGDGVVAAVLAHKKPFVCLPEPRPYDEQMVKAARLAALGAATIAYEWPDALQWAGLLVAAQSCVARWPVELDTPGGAGPVAHWLAEIARCVSRNRDFVH